MCPDPASQFSQILVNELDGNRAFADRRRDPLDRAMAHIPGDEDARHAGFEQEGHPVELPAFRRLAVADQIVAGEDEAVLVALDDAFQPVGVRLRADEDEQPRRRVFLGVARLVVDQRDRFEMLSRREPP